MNADVISDMILNQLDAPTTNTFHILEHLEKKRYTRILSFPKPLNSHELKELANFIRFNTTVKHLNLFGHQIGENGLAILLPALLNNKKITELNLGNNNLTNKAISLLCETLCNRRYKIPIMLSLQQNQITAQSCNALNFLLQTNHLSGLNLSGNDLGHNGLSLLFYNIEGSHCLKLILANTVQNDDYHTQYAIHALCHFLSKNRRLQTLDLSHNSLMDQDLLLICNSLSTITDPLDSALTDLNIAENHFTNASISALAGLLQYGNLKLTKLNISFLYPITFDIAYAFAQALTTNTTLQSLNLFHDNLNDSGKYILLRALIINIQQYDALLNSDPRKYSLWLRIFNMGAEYVARYHDLCHSNIEITQTIQAKSATQLQRQSRDDLPEKAEVQPTLQLFKQDIHELIYFFDTEQYSFNRIGQKSETVEEAIEHQEQAMIVSTVRYLVKEAIEHQAHTMIMPTVRCLTKQYQILKRKMAQDEFDGIDNINILTETHSRVKKQKLATANS